MASRFVLSSAMMLGMLALAAPAKACDGYGYGGYGLGYLYQALEYRVPYFAAHPPVYYSYPVPRTYGYSPFAYPPNVLTPDVVEEVEPLTITNPYVPKDSLEAEPDPEQTVTNKQPEPLVVYNPYVTTGPSVASATNVD